MAKKIREFIKELATKGAIKSADLETALAASGLNDIELPDDFVSGFESSFMTLDRAKNDPTITAEIQKTLNRTAFNTFDQKSKDFFSLIDPADAEEISKTTETYEKYDKLRAALKKAQAAGKGKINEDANKILEEKNAEIKALQAAHAAELKKQQEEMTTVTTNGLLTQKILAHKFADAFAGLRGSIADLVVTNVRKKYTLSLDKGELRLLQPVQGSDSMVEAFEGNTKLTVDALLEKELDQFIAKSNGTGDSKKETKEAVRTPDLKNATLSELRALQAVQQ